MSMREQPVAEREIVVSAMIDGPPEVVFGAFSQPSHLDQWWGPEGFTTTTNSFEFRPGGEWEFTMLGPEGTVYPNLIEWIEIEPNDRIVLRHGERRDDPDAFFSTITFAARGSGTEVVLRSVFPTKAHRDRAVHEFHAIEGGQQTLQRLSDYVSTLANRGQSR